jgi:hypothetical protein
LFKRVLSGREKRLGAEHPETLWAQVALGGIHQQQGRFAEAAKLSVHALEGMKKRLREGHLETVRRMSTGSRRQKISSGRLARRRGEKMKRM